MSDTIRTLAAALSRTGTACESEVPLGVGNSLVFEVTYWCNTEAQKSPPDQHWVPGQYPWNTPS
jgi:hypothetical protein